MKRRDFLKAVPIAVGMAAVAPGLLAETPKTYVGLFTSDGKELKALGYERQRFNVGERVEFSQVMEIWGPIAGAFIVDRDGAGLFCRRFDRDIYAYPGDTLNVDFRIDA